MLVTGRLIPACLLLLPSQLLSSLDHPNIIGYKECFIDADESLCIVTSFCEEGDLFKRIRDKAAHNEMFQEEEIMDMFIQVCTHLRRHACVRVPQPCRHAQRACHAGPAMLLPHLHFAPTVPGMHTVSTRCVHVRALIAPPLCTQIASSLMYIHSKKVLHRDLKTQVRRPGCFSARLSVCLSGCLSGWWSGWQCVWLLQCPSC